MQIFLWVIAVLVGLAAISTIALIGAERKPITPLKAVIKLLINGTIAGFAAYFALTQ